MGRQSFIGFKMAYDSVRREVLYNILMEFVRHIKLVRLIKMILHEPIVKPTWVICVLHFLFRII
jgi:hypothetical protein